MFKFLKAQPSKPQRADDNVDKDYNKMRWQVFIGIFVGYAGYYLVRKNFTQVLPDLVKDGFNKTELGFALSFLAISYGISKFIMGNVSDRSNVRYFMPLGLMLSAVIMIIMGVMPWATSSIFIMSVLLFLNGWVQGMGWPPSGRTMVYWFSVKERGTKMSIWNVAHNYGGAAMPILALLGLELFSDWHAKFYFPGMVALIISVVIFVYLRGRPKSMGLPSIEKWEGKKLSFWWYITHDIKGAIMLLLNIVGLEIIIDTKTKVLLPILDLFNINPNWIIANYFNGILAIVTLLLILKSKFFNRKANTEIESPEKTKEAAVVIHQEIQEISLTAKEIFTKHILPNKLLWSIAFANAFVYLVRYGIQDWAPLYLTEVKGFTDAQSGWAFSMYELAGIPGTIICGILSDKVFNGRRAPVSIIYMVLVVIAVFVYWKNPVGNPIIDYTCLIAIGFLIYGPVMLIGVHALDLVDKSAAGTAAGLTGFFGYFIGTAFLANILGGYIIDKFDYNGYFILMLLASVVSIGLIALTIQKTTPEDDLVEG